MYDSLAALSSTIAGFQENMRPFQTIILGSLLAIQFANPLPGAPVTFAARQAIELTNAIITLADINKDGHTDIIAADLSPVTNLYQVSIQLGSGSGTFTQGPAIDLGPGFYPTAIATGDFNGDGLVDIAVLSSSSRAVYILLQEFQGFSVTPIQIAEDTSQAQNIAVADLNRDRMSDLIIPSAAGTVVLLSSGGGHFQTPVLANTTSSIFVQSADINNDKKPDIVTSGGSCCFGTALTVLLGDGHGGFYAPLFQPSLGGIQSRFTLSDLNKDGKVDIAAIGAYTPSSILVALGNGDGTFAASNSYGVPSQYGSGLSIVSADLQGDGLPDLLLVTSSYLSNSLLTFLNVGKGVFGPSNAYPVPLNSIYVGAGNFNSDTYPDVVVSANGQGSVASLLFNNGHGGLMDGELVTSVQSAAYLVTGDFNGDGKPDLAAVNQGTGLSILLNNGNNKNLFTPLPNLPYYSGPLVAADFNNDGREDLVILNSVSGETLLGNGDGSFLFVPSSFSTGSGYPSSAIAADVNGDGKLDLITNAPSVNLGNGDGTFQAPSSVPYYCYGGGAVAVADFNNDGKLDVATGCQGYVTVFPGNGDGSLNFPSYQGYAPGLLSLTAGDFNHDGIPDIVFTSNPNYFYPGSTTATILLGQGNGSFATGVTIPVLTGTSGVILAGHFDGSQALDFAVLDNTDSVVTIVRGNGNGTFQIPEIFGAGSNPSCMVGGRFRSGSQPAEQDLAFCTAQGIELDLNTTK